VTALGEAPQQTGVCGCTWTHTPRQTQVSIDGRRPEQNPVWSSCLTNTGFSRGNRDEPEDTNYGHCGTPLTFTETESRMGDSRVGRRMGTSGSVGSKSEFYKMKRFLGTGGGKWLHDDNERH
jgi:hypothetical protein